MNVWSRIALVALGCLAGALGFTWLLFVAWLHAPAAHVLQAIEYLLASGVVSVAIGTLALLAVSRVAPSLGLKIGVACTFGSLAAITNVLVTPLLMFKERSDLDILVVTLLYFMAISLAFGFIVSILTTRQVHALRVGAARVASGELGARVPVQGADEVADLARAFNRMSTELSESSAQRDRLERARTDLVAAVSHDLRTPLTSIRAMVEAILDGVVAEPDAVQRYLRLIQQETEHLGRLIDDLFELARIESGSLELRLASVPLGELVAETVDGLQIQAEEKGVDLHVRCDPDLPRVTVDGPRVQRALVNLIDNAIRHTPAGGSVHVEVGRQNGQVQVAVVDTGEGIAPEDQPHVFDQFYRGEKSRSRQSGGAGLGLAIARGIVEAHRGNIRVESAPNRGSRFVVTL